MRLVPLSLFALALALALAACGGGSGQPADDLARRAFDLINDHRTSMSLDALVWSEVIAAPCAGHSADMASGAVDVGHDGFEDRVAEIAAALPLSAAGENVGMNAGYDDPAARAVEGWLDSPPHRANIEGDYNLSAMGAAQDDAGGVYFTQIFVLSP